MKWSCRLSPSTQVGRAGQICTLYMLFVREGVYGRARFATEALGLAFLG